MKRPAQVVPDLARRERSTRARYGQAQSGKPRPGKPRPGNVGSGKPNTEGFVMLRRRFGRRALKHSRK